jgi:hypothetical protein
VTGAWDTTAMTARRHCSMTLNSTSMARRAL